MSTQIDVCNGALIELGSSLLLTALDDSTAAARILKARWDLSRRTVLQSRPWGFARKRFLLSADPTVAPFGLSVSRFRKPADFIRFVLDRDNHDQDYQEEGEFFLSGDGAPFELYYIFDETNIARWSPVAADVLAAQLAARCAYAITGDKGVREDMEALYARRLSAASHIDSFNQEPVSLDSDTWLRSRQQ